MTFNVGDQVRVTKHGVSFDENGMGVGYKWCNQWVEHRMDIFVDQCCTITAYDQEAGYELDRGYWFPENVLERVYR